MIKKQNKGFTLMEVLIYTAILSITGTILSGVLLNATRIKSRETAVIEVNNQLNFALQNIQRSIADSSIIDITSGVSTSTLTLKLKNEAKNPTQFYVSGGVLYKKEGANDPQPVTDASVIVDAVNFLKVSGYSGHDSVQIDLTLSYATQNPAAAFSRTLSSAIARVSAATFDSNLIPGADNFYDVGLSATKWKDLYLSGVISVNSTTATSTFANGIEITGGCFKFNGSCFGSQWVTSGSNIYYSAGGVQAGIFSAIPVASLSSDGNPLLIQAGRAGGGVGSSFNSDPNTATKSGGNLTLEAGGGSHWGKGGDLSMVAGDTFDANSVAGNILIKAQGQDISRGYIGFFTNTGTYPSVISTEQMRISGNGNVGIGTTTPVTKLQINSTASANVLRLSNSATAAITNYVGNEYFLTNNTGENISYGGIRVQSTGVTQAANAETGKMIFSVKESGIDPNATDRMVIDTNGNIGIGTTSPNSLLTVAGNTEIGTGTRGMTLNSSGADNFNIRTFTNTPNPNWTLGYGNGVGALDTTKEYISANAGSINFIHTKLGLTSPSGGTGFSAATNGYTYLPNGIIMQWGRVTGIFDTTVAVTFPIAFPTVCASMSAIQVGNVGGDPYVNGFKVVAGPTTAGFTVSARDNGSNDWYWMAVGY